MQKIWFNMFFNGRFNLNSSKNKFKDIENYGEKSQVDAALSRLIKSPYLYASLFKLKFPKMQSSILMKATRLFFNTYTKFKLKKITSVEEVQILVKKYLDLLIKSTSSKINISGIENLKNLNEKPAVFISNHRDIVFDPAILNYALNQAGFTTTKIAIGDNLVKDKAIEDLMRLNKSFLVQRNIKGLKENLKAMQILSEYINFSLKKEKSSIWLAQRQGRAKDGHDKTDTGVLRMLALANKRVMSLSDNIKNLNLIPVAISYEYDPCDFLKAQELETIKATGSYKKSDFEDIQSMRLGLMGFKGEVSVHFCTPLNQDKQAKASGAFADINKLAEYLDATIIDNYQLYSTNMTAFDAFTRQSNYKKNQDFLARIATYKPEIRTRVLEIYANPLINKSASEAYFDKLKH